MSESNNDLSHPILKLTPQEKAAYSHLFSLADSDSLGVVTGERAVSFFEKTHVPANVLGEIWQIADTENRGLLTKPGFCMVLRLIGWHQNGSTPSTELAFKPAPLPKFDGITVPQAPQVSGQQPQSPTAGDFPQNALQPQPSGQGPIRVPPLDPTKVQQYSGLFERSGAINGLLDGGSAKGIFEKAGLPNEVLGKIWMLSDREQRGALDQTEFIIAMHLLTSMKTRAMTALPATLPQGLYDAAARRGQRPPSRQSSVPVGAGAIPRQFTGGQAPRAQSPLARPPGYATPPPVSAQTTGAPWLITQQEKSQYDRFFATIDTSSSGIISGEQAVRFFSDSRLPEDTLASIWDLADINSEGQLNKDEFAVAMYLIRQQRAPNAPPLPAFLPAGLIPPSMRGQQQSQQSTAPAFDTSNAPPQPSAQKSASEDLFGLDSSPTQAQQPTLQPQGTGASATRDPFGGSQPGSPSSPQRFQPQPTGGTMFKPFMPTSAFGASLASQHTGQSTTSSQGQAQPQQPLMSGFQQQKSAPTAMDDLLGDNDTHAEESSKLNTDTTELANMSNQIGNLRNQMETTQSKKAATSAELNATNQQKQQLEQRLQQFRTQYESEVRAVKEMEQQLATSKENTKKLGQELAMIEGSYQDLQTQHQTVSQQLQADQQENAHLKQRIAQMNSEVASLKPQVEKMKLDARQQKGMVSINKKQLSTNESERDRLQTEKSDLEREAAETARSAAASPEPFQAQPSNVASPAGSTMASTNPFFRMTSSDGATSPPAQSSSGPTPSAFDALFGPSSHFAPSGQAGSRTGTPPATSFIGRSMPAAVAAGVGGAGVGAGGMAMADSMSSAGEPTPSATPPLSDQAKESPLASDQLPPPPESRQFTPPNLPIMGGVTGPQSETGDSTKVMPPASRAGEPETPGALEREIVPGAFPDDESQPTTSAQEISSSTGPSTQTGAPAVTSKTTDDFDSAFAGFGRDQAPKEAGNSASDPFAQTQPAPTQQRGLNSEFPPIQNIESDDDSSSGDDDSDAGGFGDDFASSSQPQSETAPAAVPNGTENFRPRVASGDDIAATRPGIQSMESTASDLPPINKEASPPTYEQSDSAALGGCGERTESNNFPPEFGNLLPAREDPTSPPPPATSPPADDAASAASTLQPNDTGNQSVLTPSTDTFVDAFSRPMSMATDTSPQNAPAPAAEIISKPTPAPAAPKNAFDDFDDFADLSEAKEADDKNASDFDFGFGGAGRESTDDFNPAFDTPAQNTPMTRSVQPSQDSTYSSAPTNGNGGADSFSAFAPSQSTSSAFGSSTTGGNSSVQQTPQNVQHDWDAIFSGLDSSKAPDTSLGGNEDSDPWGTSAPAEPTTTSGPVNGAAASGLGSSAAMPSKGKDIGRAITPGTEHDDPILKRLTTMGYARQDALNALEMFDYDINKAVDHLAGS